MEKSINWKQCLHECQYLQIKSLQLTLSEVRRILTKYSFKRTKNMLFSVIALVVK